MMDESPATIQTPLAPLRDRRESEAASPPQACLQRPNHGTPEGDKVAGRVALMAKRYEQGVGLWEGERLTGEDRAEVAELHSFQRRGG